MRRTRTGKRLFVLAVALIIGWQTIWAVNRLDGRNDAYDATRLLYQVALFQMELLSSQMKAAGAASTTPQLALLQQSAYAAQYTHQRLALALGGPLAELGSLDVLMQYMFRLEIGGSRALTDEERAVFADAAPAAAELYDAYKELLSGDNRLVSSRNERLAHADGQLGELFRRRLLE